MLLRGSEVRNNTVKFSSPIITISRQTNLIFWYHMNGIGIGNLFLYQETLDGHHNVLWHKSGRQSSQWLNTSVTLPFGKYKVGLMPILRNTIISNLIEPCI